MATQLVVSYARSQYSLDYFFVIINRYPLKMLFKRCKSLFLKYYGIYKYRENKNNEHIKYFKQTINRDMCIVSLLDAALHSLV